MPSVTSRRRSRSVFEDGDGDEPSGSEVGKRQRRHQNGTNLKGEPESEDDRPFPTAASRRSRPKANGTSSARRLDQPDTEYQPGAIVRVLVKNFVTYEHAEFLPGPNLNMVIGPNGTGKSSLVCAICLGLGFSPKTLGRADNWKEFVKHGKDTAIVEIEIQKRPEDRRNPVFKVQISREDNNRKWWLNDQETPFKSIQEMQKIYRIQINNLCQFLPQDKVAEFAGLSPVQLLHETLRAAAPEQMINWQAQLKEYHADHKKLQDLLASTSETLQSHEARQQGLQADVDRLNEREAIKEKIDDWKKARSCAEYDAARDRYREANRKRKDAEKRLKELENASGPALEAVNQKEEYQAKIEAVIVQRKKLLKNAEAGAAQGLQAIEAQDEVIESVQANMTAERKSFQTKKDEVGKTRKIITTLQGRRNKEPVPFNNSEWNEKIRAQEHILHETEAEKREVSARIEEILQAGREVQKELRSNAQKIDALNSQEGQQLHMLEKDEPEIFKGWQWLRENQHEFEKEVFGPPMLTCSLKDKRYTDVIQSLLSKDDFLCFTAQTQNDHKKLSNKFYKEMGLSVSIRTCGRDYQSFRPPMSGQEARRLGLDGFAIDNLEGPEPVLAMLCSEKKLNTSGVALREVSNEQFDELVHGEKIPQWATGETNFRVVRRREYGPDATTTTTRKVRPGKYWTDQPVDNVEKVKLQQVHEEKTEVKKRLHAEFKEKQDQLEKLRANDEELQATMIELKRQKNELQLANTQWQALPDKIAVEQENLNALLQDLSACKARMAGLEAQHDEAIIGKAKAVLSYKDKISAIRNAHQAALDVEIRLIEARSDVRGLKERNMLVLQNLEAKKEEIGIWVGEAETAKREAHKAREKVQAMVSEDEGHGIEYYNGLIAGKTLEDIDHEIVSEEAQLELIHGADPSVLRQFEKRRQEIEALGKKKEELAGKLKAIGEHMDELRNRWEPKLDELMAKINDAFSNNFAKISCAGEVGVHKDEDFDQWAIEIKVKFRPNETLQQLNQHRQSGGERAVSTIFYLMALQSMAQAPFRVVDEINQGMDPRNERMVHERMVEIACREHTSQYFLITPKLLTGLRYDERMRVLCIASGEHMPEEGRKLNFSKLISIRRALKAAA